MSLKFQLVLFVSLLVGLTCACESKTERWETEKQQSEQRLAAIETELSSLQKKAAGLTAEVKANHNQTMQLLRANPGIVSCIAAGSVVVEDGNLFKEDMKQLGALWGLGCIVAYVFGEEFQEQVDSFMAEIGRKSAKSKELQNQLNAVTQKSQAKGRERDAERRILGDLHSKIQEFNSKSPIQKLLAN